MNIIMIDPQEGHNQVVKRDRHPHNSKTDTLDLVLGGRRSESSRQIPKRHTPAT